MRGHVAVTVGENSEHDPQMRHRDWFLNGGQRLVAKKVERGVALLCMGSSDRLIFMREQLGIGDRTERKDGSAKAALASLPPEAIASAKVAVCLISCKGIFGYAEQARAAVQSVSSPLEHFNALNDPTGVLQITPAKGQRLG